MILFIHRKDLRTHDLAAFEYMARSSQMNLHIFIADPALLTPVRRNEHSGVHFLSQLRRLQELYIRAGRKLHILHGDPARVVDAILEQYPVREMVIGQDYTPYALARDNKLEQAADRHGVLVTSLPDQTLIDLEDFHAFAGRKEPYKVFTPFYRKWKEYAELFFRPPGTTSVSDLRTADLEPEFLDRFRLPFQLEDYLSGEEPGLRLADFIMDDLSDYEQERDRYEAEGTSRISGALNTGSLSIRTVYQQVMGIPDGESWRRQLAWRDFYLYQSVYDPDFYHYEQRYDLSLLDDKLFTAWSQAETGIPVIDAAMTQLNKTGQLPNRLRMVTAMFLTKNLLCPFPLGEAYFRLKLSDYDNAPNRGGWLWSSSLGFDAAPYFRIMNPVNQSEKFDPLGGYIRRWLPQLADAGGREIHRPLPHAIVDLKASRERAIQVYKEILRSRVAGESE
ncbi:deoxyribodipyrimidine photo-lyase [Paenibacillus sp. YPG26]|uniref:cryptochrome/photolyase family protein n=1 Tax=Paenibacillus sp. YPG26 TaxID=2878915 RepID=UPI00203FE88A|nr:deoxyribodipyrimidine photo-lyase [Paenibacillus sp. YPG26]USB31954.1 DNA photolyase family protein [Paenibacillus sp. YPG26]